MKWKFKIKKKLLSLLLLSLILLLLLLLFCPDTHFFIYATWLIRLQTSMQWLRFILPENSIQKKGFYIPTSTLIQWIEKKLCLSKKFINKKCHYIKYSNFEWKSFLSLTNKDDFYSEHFSNQKPNQKNWVAYTKNVYLVVNGINSILWEEIKNKWMKIGLYYRF